MSKGVMRFRNMTLGRQQGELARLRVLGGPDNGIVFVITASRITIGRGGENDLILSDVKASRRHMELNIGAGSYSLRDLGSSHGFVLNGASQKLAALKNGDKIGVGETVMEFIGAEAGATQMIMAPPSRTAMAVGTGASGLTQFIPRPGGNAAPGVKPAGSQQSFLERNKKMILALGGLMAMATLLPEVEQKQRAKKNKYLEPKEMEASRNLSSLDRPQVDPNVYKSAEIYYREGFREFRAKNFSRAQVAFETALQIHPDHALARVYLESTKKSMEEEAKEHLEAGKKDEEANRLRGARNHYDAVKRLFSKDQSNPKYKEADVKIIELEKRIAEAEKDR